MNEVAGSENSKVIDSGADTKLFSGYISRVSEALIVAEEKFSVSAAKKATQVMEAAKERLDLGVDHTVVALIGGTGSGKSSTFNALSKLEFADVGAKRPTTAKLTACVWSSTAGPLLDWLDVDFNRRITRDTALDGPEEQALNGLVLLDLPDYDSVAGEHREIVERILPLADLLVWIVDPQKYADHALHQDYLQRMVGSKTPMFVVLNQIDRVAEYDREALIEDLSSLLVKSNLSQAQVKAISALHGIGVSELREELRQLVAKRSVAASRLSEELTKVGQQLMREVPSQVMVDASGLADGLEERISVALGMSSLHSELEAKAITVKQDAEVSLPSASEAELTVIKDNWLERVSAGMTDSWREYLTAQFASSAKIAEELDSKLAKVANKVSESKKAKTIRNFALFQLVLAAILGIAAGVFFLTEFLTFPVSLAVAGGSVILLISAGMTWLAAKKRKRKDAKAEADTVVVAIKSSISEVVNENFVEPAQGVLAEHKRIRTLVNPRELS